MNTVAAVFASAARPVAAIANHARSPMTKPAMNASEPLIPMRERRAMIARDAGAGRGDRERIDRAERQQAVERHGEDPPPRCNHGGSSVNSSKGLVPAQVPVEPGHGFAVVVRPAGPAPADAEIGAVFAARHRDESGRTFAASSAACMATDCEYGTRSSASPCISSVGGDLSRTRACWVTPLRRAPSTSARCAGGTSRNDTTKAGAGDRGRLRQVDQRRAQHDGLERRRARG